MSLNNANRENIIDYNNYSEYYDNCYPSYYFGWMFDFDDRFDENVVLRYAIKEGHFNGQSYCMGGNITLSTSAQSYSYEFTPQPSINSWFGYEFCTIQLPSTSPWSGGGGSSFNIAESANNYSFLVGYNSACSDTLLYDTHVYMNNGYLYSQSDENKKIFIGDVECDFNKLKSIPKKYYKWIDDVDGKVNIGTSAQKVWEIYPDIVNMDNGTPIGVAYDRLSIIALAAIDKLHEENEYLKNKIEILEEELTKVKNDED